MITYCLEVIREFSEELGKLNVIYCGLVAKVKHANISETCQFIKENTNIMRRLGSEVRIRTNTCSMVDLGNLSSEVPTIFILT